MTPVDGRRFMLRVWAIVEARRIVKARLKAQGLRPSYYAAAEISRMAQQYLNEGHWAELELEALLKIVASPRAWAEYLAAGARFEKAMARARKKVA